MAINLSFPDLTYSSSNKPSAVTLKSDLAIIETAVNAAPGLSDNNTFTGNQIITGSLIAKLNAPQGFLINGKISVLDAAGITVAIKTLAGADPSATDPVYVRIGDTIRTISAALSVAKADGTNWFNSGGTELATKEIDYFVYLGYNATDGVVLGFARIPFANQYSDFSATTTNEKYCAISTITTAASTDYYEVIGRFAATLSATAAFTWTVPTFTAINLIQRPIYETRQMTFTITPSGNMTVASLVTNLAQYKIFGNRCKADVNFTVTTSAGPGNEIRFVVPFSPSSTTQTVGLGQAGDATGVGCFGYFSSTTILACRRFDASVWGTGAGRGPSGNLEYSI